MEKKKRQYYQAGFNLLGSTHNLLLLKIIRLHYYIDRSLAPLERSQLNTVHVVLGAKIQVINQEV